MVLVEMHAKAALRLAKVLVNTPVRDALILATEVVRITINNQ